MEVIKEWLKTILYACIIVLILYFFAWPVTIEGESMEPTFSDGDKVVTSRVLTRIEKYEVGDIVVFHMADNDGQRDVIKRVIGVAGDKIDIKDGMVYRNDLPLAEEYVNGVTQGDISVIVPEKSLFVLGDNRGYSYDSRMIGCISQKDLKGKVIFRWYPFYHMGKF